jgi:malate dehydrogenase (oxaloacetate-decarboxylating)(NADP+)
MGIPVGKLSLYPACAGVPPQYCLPVMLDVGTNNADLREDALYLGLRQDRVRRDEYHAFVNEFIEAVQTLFPKCCVQWEDFANFKLRAQDGGLE